MVDPLSNLGKTSQRPQASDLN